MARGKFGLASLAWGAGVLGIIIAGACSLDSEGLDPATALTTAPTGGATGGDAGATVGGSGGATGGSGGATGGSGGATGGSGGSDPCDRLRIDDGNQCTDDSCADGVVTHDGAPNEDEPCRSRIGEGVCADGECAIACDSVNECETGNPCETPACERGLCAYTAALDGTLVGDASQSDCVQDACIAGAVVSGGADDDDDLPDDADDCTIDSCVAGVADHAPAPADTPCGNNGACDGAGSCVGCVDDGDCPADTFCKAWACDSATDTCIGTDTAAGTDLPPSEQTGNDCALMECNGAGAPQQTPDGSDLPTQIANDCMVAVCSAGAVVQQADNTDCAGGVCYMGECCDPMSAADACSAQCGTADDGCGGTIVCDNGVSDIGETGVDCGGFSCPDCANGQSCISGLDCVSGSCKAGEDVCCDPTCSGSCRSCDGTFGAKGACLPVPFGQEHGFCLFGSACDGAGDCKNKIGSLCGSSSDCLPPMVGGTPCCGSNFFCGGTGC